MRLRTALLAVELDLRYLGLDVVDDLVCHILAEPTEGLSPNAAHAIAQARRLYRELHTGRRGRYSSWAEAAGHAGGARDAEDIGEEGRTIARTRIPRCVPGRGR